jgi:hypothetical protein
MIQKICDQEFIGAGVNMINLSLNFTKSILKIFKNKIILFLIKNNRSELA